MFSALYASSTSSLDVQHTDTALTRVTRSEKIIERGVKTNKQVEIPIKYTTFKDVVIVIFSSRTLAQKELKRLNGVLITINGANDFHANIFGLKISLIWFSLSNSCLGLNIGLFDQTKCENINI